MNAIIFMMIIFLLYLNVYIRYECYFAIHKTGPNKVDMLKELNKPYNCSKILRY